MKWPYMGDPNPNSPLKRAPNPAAIEMAKNHLQNPMGCIHCHDPHAAKPRVIRDALIEVVVDRGEGTYPYDQAEEQGDHHPEDDVQERRAGLPGHRSPEQTRLQPDVRPVPRGIQLQPRVQPPDRGRPSGWTAA